MGAGRPIDLVGRAGDELRAELFEPGGRAEGSGVLVVPDGGRIDEPARLLADRIAAAGRAALVPELGRRVESDRTALADLEAALARLAQEPGVDPERVGAVGLGRGGTRAFLLGCHSQRLAAVVDVDGPLRYEELSAERPVQPLELALNLDAPLLLVWGAGDARNPSEDVRRAEQVLGQFAKPFELEVVAGAAAAAEAATWTRVLAFLDEHLSGAPARRGEDR